MIEIFGDAWKIWQMLGGFDAYPSVLLGVTTNGAVNRSGKAVMGRGIAKEAALKYPNLPRELANNLELYGNRNFYFFDYCVTTFPVKHVWSESADLALIEQSAAQLRQDLDLLYTAVRVVLCRPGTGNGQLLWNEVKPIMQYHFGNCDRLILVARPGEYSPDD